jgi:hypothetical protein
MIDDDVGHDVNPLRQRCDVAPPPKTRIDAGVIDRVETGVRTVDRIEERQQVNRAEHAVQRASQQRCKVAKAAAAGSIYISDQLDLILHGLQ